MINTKEKVAFRKK